MPKHHGSAGSIPNDLDTLRGVAATLGLEYDRLRQARLRNAETFPTVTIAGSRFHRAAEVAEWLGTTPRSRLRTRDT